MAELIPQERLQPALLDRLTDDEPDKQVESREQRVISVDRLYDCIVRDLSWLLNAENLSTNNDLRDHPEVARSTLNYGVPSLSGVTASQVDNRLLEDQIRTSILSFEPRLLPHTVVVNATVDDSEMQQNAVTLVIEATAWGQPLPIHLLVKAVVDLETGSFSVDPV